MGLIALSCISCGDLGAIIHIPGIIFVLGGGFAVTIISFTFNDISNAFSQVFRKKEELSKRCLAIYFWLAMMRNLLAVGAIGTLIGAIFVMGNIEDMSYVRSSMKLLLHPFFYGIFFCGIFPLPAYYIVQRRLVNDSAQKEDGK